MNDTENKTNQFLSKSTQKSSDRQMFFQPKLFIDTRRDQYEQEADAMAENVMRMHVPGSESFFKPAANIIQCKCLHCEEEQKLHRKESSGSETEAPDSLGQYVGSLGSSGRPLPASSRQFFEPRFGHDFSNVSIHTDSVAAKSAQSIHALAYTSGNHIVFNQRQYSPENESGQRLMAHELTHVVQQSNNIQPYRSKGSIHYGEGEESFRMSKDRNKKPWIEEINVKLDQPNKYGPGYSEGSGIASYYDNTSKMLDIGFSVVGGYPDDARRKSGAGHFKVYRIEGMGYNSDSYSGDFDRSEREKTDSRYSKMNDDGNMNYAVFYNKAEALHEGPLDSGSHGCMHLSPDSGKMKQINYHSVIGFTKVNISY